MFQADQWLYEGEKLTEVFVEHQVLSPVEIYECEIEGARLSGSTLKRWVFEDCVLKDCDLSNLTFEQCTFVRCRFLACRLIGSDWRSTGLITELSFVDSDLSYSQLNGINMPQTRFERSRCIEVDFTKTNLSKASFIETTVEQARFEQANLAQADLTGALHEEFDPQVSTMTDAVISLETAIRLAEVTGLRVKR